MSLSVCVSLFRARRPLSTFGALAAGEIEFFQRVSPSFGDDFYDVRVEIFASFQIDVDEWRRNVDAAEECSGDESAVDEFDPFETRAASYERRHPAFRHAKDRREFSQTFAPSIGS